MSVSEITNHVERAIDRLVQQYKEKPKLNSLIASFVEQFQELETAGKDLNDNRSINTALGTNLDNLGTIIGLTRNPGESDALFRARLQAQISQNIAQGQPEIVLDTYRLVTGEDFVLLQELYPAEVALSSAYDFADQDEVDATIAVIESILPVAVRVQYFGVFDATEAFAFDGVQPGLGFGTLSDVNVGGKFSKIVFRNNFFAFAGGGAKNEGFGTIKDTLVGGQLDSL
jgi:hypothetical protein